jgi:hypothetical protein
MINIAFPQVNLERRVRYKLLPGGHELTTLESYYDGRGTSASRQSGFLTLAGYAAPPFVWPAFEVKWQSILEKHGAQYFHANQERHRDEPVLVAELMDTLEIASHFGMTAVSVTVEMEAYGRLFLKHT